MLERTAEIADMIITVSGDGDTGGDAGSIEVAGRFTPQWGSDGVAGKRELVVNISGVDDERRKANVTTAVGDGADDVDTATVGDDGAD